MYERGKGGGWSSGAMGEDVAIGIDEQGASVAVGVEGNSGSTLAGIYT